MQVAILEREKFSLTAEPTPSDPDDMADIVVSYGTTVETYRGEHRRSPSTPTLKRTTRSPGSAPPLQNSNLVTVTLPVARHSQRRTAANGARTRSLMRRRRRRTGRSSTRSRLRAGVRGQRLPRQGAHLQPARDTRDHRPRRHLGSRRVLRAQAGLLHHGHPVAVGADSAFDDAAHCSATAAAGPDLERRPPRPGRRGDNAVGRLPGQHQRGALLPLARDDRPGYGGSVHGPAERVRGRDVRPGGQRARSLEVPGRYRDGPPRHDRCRSERGHERQPARGPQPERPRLPQAVPGHRHRDIRRADDGRRRRQHRQQQWKYVAVRRMALFIEQTLYASLTWAVFEGNSTPLWNALTQEVTAFMLSLFRQNAFAGDTPSQAFLVQCDATTTTPTDAGERHRQHPRRLRPAPPGGVRRRPDRAARRPGTELASMS